MGDGATHSKENILENEVLTVKEVAAYLRVSRVTVWRWCQRGTLPALRVGRNWRIHRDDLLNLLERPQPLSSAPP
jgi:excisionase family DNA binding protein